MKKSQKMKDAARKARIKNIKNWCKKILSFPWRAIKWLWRLICRICRAIWNWLKSIDIIGMINLTLLVAIIVLFASLISDFVRCNRCSKMQSGNTKENIVMVTQNKKAMPVLQPKQKIVDNRKVVQRKFSTVLPVRSDLQTNITPKIKTVGVAKPQIVRELSVPANELPQQKLSGDVIVDILPSSPILSNGVNIDGNLFLQNMRKFTLPCGAVIKGNLFVRNVDKLSFCGEFTVMGNIYVNRQSSFGPIPKTARIGGQVIL